MPHIDDLHRGRSGRRGRAMYVRTTNALWYRSSSKIRGLCARADTLSSTGAQQLGWMALYVFSLYFLPPLPAPSLCCYRGRSGASLNLERAAGGAHLRLFFFLQGLWAHDGRQRDGDHVALARRRRRRVLVRDAFAAQGAVRDDASARPRSAVRRPARRFGNIGMGSFFFPLRGVGGSDGHTFLSGYG